MTDLFHLIVEEFTEDIEAIRSLVSAFSLPDHPPKLRVAAANSATLLLAATFEEFVREMARSYAKQVVERSSSPESVPISIMNTAWKRTMAKLGNLKVAGQGNGVDSFAIAQSKFSVIYEFCKGDFTKDIYRDLIHNENNMHPSQINNLFKIAGLNDICRNLSSNSELLDFFGETNCNKCHGMLIKHLDDFFERRNQIAHALNPQQSSGSTEIIRDLEMFLCFAKSLSRSLHSN